MRLVFKCTNDPRSFFLPVTEIGLRYNAGDVKRILHNVSFVGKSKKKNPIIQILS